jgi:hypothetical protein
MMHRQLIVTKQNVDRRKFLFFQLALKNSLSTHESIFYFYEKQTHKMKR